MKRRNPGPDLVATAMIAGLVGVVIAARFGIAIRSEHPHRAGTSWVTARVAQSLSTSPVSAPMPPVTVLRSAVTDGAPAPTCSGSQLSGVLGGDVSVSGGEHSVLLDFTNVSPATRSLRGYPTVVLTAGPRELPLVYQDGGDYISPPGSPAVTASALTLAPGTTVSVRLAKYRCDIGAGTILADNASVRLPGVSKPITIYLGDSGGGDDLPYCWSEDGPGDAIYVSVQVSPLLPLDLGAH